MKYKKGQQGFTLLEMIVVMAITSILLISIVGIIQVNGNLIKKTNTQIDAKTLALAIQDSIRSKLKFAEYVVIDNEKTHKIVIDSVEKPAVSIFIDTVGDVSSLKYQENPSTVTTLISGVLMEGLEPTISFSKESDRAIGLNVAIRKDEVLQYTLDTVIEMINSPGGEGAIIINNSEENSVISFTKP